MDLYACLQTLAASLRLRVAVCVQVANLGKSGVSVGYYDTQEAAAKAYDRAAISLLGKDNGSISTNFPLKQYQEDQLVCHCLIPYLKACLLSVPFSKCCAALVGGLHTPDSLLAVILSSMHLLPFVRRHPAEKDALLWKREPFGCLTGLSTADASAGRQDT